MQKGKRFSKTKSSLAVSEVIILLISMFAFAYLVGQEFPSVNATDVCTKNVKTGQPVKVTGINNVNDQIQVNAWCINNGGSDVCDGGSGAWFLRQTICTSSGKVQPTAQQQTQPTAPSITPTPTQGIGQSAEKQGITLGEVATACTLAGCPKPKLPNPFEKSRAPTGTESGGGGGQPKPGILSRLGFGNQVTGSVTGWSALKALGWASVIYVGVRWISQSLGASPAIANAAAAASAAGYLTYAFAPKIFGAAAAGGPVALVAALIVAVVVFLSGYFGSNEGKYDAVTFSCYPWQAPKGGNECTKCNTGDFPCTEYRCKSLGQSCELVNKGTKEELCVFKSRNDINAPIIQPWIDTLTTGYNYNPDNTISPPDRGVKIVPQGNLTGCIQPFTPLRFGVMTDEPSSCKIDTVNTPNFASMKNFWGGSPTLKYNHSQTLILPGTSQLAQENLTIQNGGKMTFYTRCQDAKGNTNSANFVMKFCVDQGPDRTPPTIVTTSILNGMPIAFGTTTESLDLLVNEPATCKWSHLDQSYDDMSDSTLCSTGGVTNFNAQMLYKCSTSLTGLKDRMSNDFYFRCKDQPLLAGTNRSFERNANTQSYKFTLIGTQPLVITSASPNGTTISDSTDVIRITLNATTFAGYHQGDATCSYKDVNLPDNYIDFFDTGTSKHSQDLWLTAGNYVYSIKCVDLGGNPDTTTINFTVDTDTNSPLVVRVFKQENQLKIITSEHANCVYGNVDCTYLFSDGVKMNVLNGINGLGRTHGTPWNTDKTFFIKCQDKFGNQPMPNQCSIVAKPFDVPVAAGP